MAMNGANRRQERAGRKVGRAVQMKDIDALLAGDRG
jgi:hypothetical protein